MMLLTSEEKEGKAYKEGGDIPRGDFVLDERVGQGADETGLTGAAVSDAQENVCGIGEIAVVHCAGGERAVCVATEGRLEHGGLAVSW